MNTATTTPVPSTKTSAQLTPLEAAVVLVCIILAAAPFVVPAIPVGTDLLKHTFVANVLAHFNDPQLNYAQHFKLVLRPRSTVLAEMLLAGIMQFAAPLLATKIMLVLAIITLWISTRFMVIQMGKPPMAALLVLPVFHSFPVFSGFLPYTTSVAVFPFLVGTLLKYPAGRARAPRVAALLVLLYFLHIVAAAVGCFMVGVFALYEFGALDWLVKLLRDHRDGVVNPAAGMWDLLSIVPTASLIVYFFFQRDGRSLHPLYLPPLLQLESYLTYNACGLSKTAGYVFLAGLALLAIAAVFGVRKRHADVRLLTVACCIFVLGLLLPIQAGDWFVVGSRTFPFALFAFVSLPDLTFSQWRPAAALGVVVLIITSIMNTQAALDVQPLYNTFLSGLNSVEYGSRVLPIIEDISLGGNVFVLPFNGVEDAYNIFRGGSNAYVFAYPSVLTGAYPIEMTWTPQFAYKFRKDEKPDYHGVSRAYDYVIVYGNLPGVIKQLESEMPLQFQNGPLRIYKGHRQ